MDRELFWSLVDRTRKASNGSLGIQTDLLVDILVAGSIDDILDYGQIMDDLMDQAYDAALWDAAYIIGCGCSSDDFLDFRAWLIGQGKQVYEEALANPESLVEKIQVNERGRAEDFQYVAFFAYERRTGAVLPPPEDRKQPELKGDHWPEQARKERSPKLAAKFGDCRKRWPLFP